MTRYIFITGGVISSLGKGLATSSISTLLKDRGLNVTLLKIDPYINVDPGTMSPYQHGEVFVTDDGAECDLDIGNYERFLGRNLSQLNNFTTGRIYDSVIRKERQGAYLGNTVQVVPHIIEEIIEKIEDVTRKKKHDFLITEVGGTIGDIESLPFIEAIRQFSQRHAADVFHIHLTLLPYIEAAGELKTKPAQHSVKKLNELGIWPNLLLCRTKTVLPEATKKKLSIFCNIPPERIIDAVDVNDIYEIPLSFKKQKLDDVILKHFHIKAPKKNMEKWRKMVNILRDPQKETTIGIIGKYVELHDAYKSIIEALKHGGIANRSRVKLEWIPAAILESEPEKVLSKVNGILVPGGFGERGIQGKIAAARYARETGTPYLGICLGMQVAVIEFARHVAGMKNASSTEFSSKCRYPVIDIMEDKRYLENYGGTLRLGQYDCRIKKGTLAHKIYGKTDIKERHRHRYEVNNKFISELTKKGLVVSGINPERKLVEIIELPDHPFFIAGQFHPEFLSRPLKAHPLFSHLVKTSLKNNLTI